MLDEALEQFTKNLDQAPHSPTVHYFIGRIYERRGDHKIAASEYRKVIKDSKSVRAQFVCQKCGEKYEEWTERCTACGRWNAIDFDLREEVPKLDGEVIPAL